MILNPYITSNEEETIDLAKEYAAKLKGGEVILLQGNLGAGKSVFVRGLAAGLKIENRITSPTFVLMKVYGVKNKVIKNFVHVDAYRVENKDLMAVGLEEYLNDKNSVVVIEWGEKVEKEFRKRKIKIKVIKISVVKAGRKINFG